MLSKEEKQAIAAEVLRYAQKRAAVPEALKIVQRSRGWVSDQGVIDIAQFLSMTPEQVEGVATFYSMIFRKPVGRHVILICDSVCCWMLNYTKLKEHLCTTLKIDLGQTSGDGKFTLLPVSCLGACDQAPAMMIDEELYGNLTTEKVDQVLAEYE